MIFGRSWWLDGAARVIFPALNESSPANSTVFGD